MRNSFLKALQNEEHDHTPVWYMRQAGRFLPEYRKVRERVSIYDLCSSPELAASISYDAARILQTDAAIIFSDIAIPMENLGYSISYREGIGPVMEKTSDEIHPAISKAGNSIRHFKLRHGDMPIIGFVGGPLTIFSYLNDSPARDIPKTRKRIYSWDSETVGMLISIRDMLENEISLQIEAGADAIQVFDSWLGYLEPEFAGKIVEIMVKPLFRKIRSRGSKGIYFSTMTSGMVDILLKSDADFLSLDWRIDLKNLRERDVGVQGNLDPSLLLYSPEAARKRAMEIVDSMKERNNYIFNLGHGILPGTDHQSVIDISKAVKSVKI